MWKHKRVMKKQGYKENNPKYKTRKTQNPDSEHWVQNTKAQPAARKEYFKQVQIIY